MSHNGTSFEFGTGKPVGEALILPMLSEPTVPLTMLNAVDKVCDGAVSELVSAKILNHDVGQIAHTTRAGGAFRRVVLVGLGKAKELSPQRVREAGAAAARWLIKAKLARATIWIDDMIATQVEEALGAWAGGMTLAGWSFGQFTSRNGPPPARIKVTLASADGGQVKHGIPEVRDAQTIADSVNYVRHLAHLPPNLLNPRSLCEEARRLATRAKLKLTLVEARKAADLGMNGLLAVGRGAVHPPALIVIEYCPLPRSRSNTVLVGKAITFDTGGYSIKPAAGMESMKFDKCGGLAVLGTLHACAALRLPCNVIGVIATAENSISGDAYKPSDIIRMANGRFVEVTNTDAEGRMVLGDALWYAQEHCRPTRMVDFATLTGGVVVALGSQCAGLMTQDDDLAAALEECGRATHERVWRLPLWDEYFDLIKGGDADFKNSSAKRQAHPIVGGIFLKQFVKPDLPWAHLDIAGVAHDDDGHPVYGKGATGFGVRLMVEYLRRYAC